MGGCTGSSAISFFALEQKKDGVRYFSSSIDFVHVLDQRQSAGLRPRRRSGDAVSYPIAAGGRVTRLAFRHGSFIEGSRLTLRTMRTFWDLFSLMARLCPPIEPPPPWDSQTTPQLCECDPASVEAEHVPWPAIAAGHSWKDESEMLLLAAPYGFFASFVHGPPTNDFSPYDFVADACA